MTASTFLTSCSNHLRSIGASQRTDDRPHDRSTNAIAQDFHFVIRKCYTDDPLVVVAGIENLWARRRKIKLAELVNEPWTWPGTLIDLLVVDAFRVNGLRPPRATINGDSIGMRIKLVATGRFLAVVPPRYRDFTTIALQSKCCPSNSPRRTGSTGSSRSKNRALSPLAQRFIECAREIAKQLTKRK